MSTLDGATERGPWNTYPSTPGEFAARWNALGEEERAELVQQLVADAEAVQTCRVKHNGWGSLREVGRRLAEMAAEHSPCHIEVIDGQLIWHVVPQAQTGDV